MPIMPVMVFIFGCSLFSVHGIAQSHNPYVVAMRQSNDLVRNCINARTRCESSPAHGIESYYILPVNLMPILQKAGCIDIADALLRTSGMRVIFGDRVTRHARARYQNVLTIAISRVVSQCGERYCPPSEFWNSEDGRVLSGYADSSTVGTLEGGIGRTRSDVHLRYWHMVPPTQRDRALRCRTRID